MFTRRQRRLCLPAELIQQIIGWLELEIIHSPLHPSDLSKRNTQTIARIARCSKLFNYLATPFLYRHLRLRNNVMVRTLSRAYARRGSPWGQMESRRTNAELQHLLSAKSVVLQQRDHSTLHEQPSLREERTRLHTRHCYTFDSAGLCSACVNPPEWSDSKHAFTSYIPTSLLSAFTTFRNLTTFHLSGCTIPDIPFVQLLGPFGSHRSQITSVTLHHCCIFYAALVWVFGIVPLACDAAPIYLLPDADMECDWDSLEDKPILLQLLDDIGAPNVMRELRFQDQENAVMRVAFADYGVFRLFHWFFFELGDPEKFKITTPPFNPFSSLVHLDFEAPMSDPIGLYDEVDPLTFIFRTNMFPSLKHLKISGERIWRIKFEDFTLLRRSITCITGRDNAMDGALHLPSYMPHWLMEPMKRELREEWAPLGMREYYGPQLDILDLKELKMGLLF